MLLFLLTKSTLVFVTSLIILLCLTAIITLLVIIILLTNDCWWQLDNYIHLGEQLHFPEKLLLKYHNDKEDDLDQIVINEEINCEESIDVTIFKNENVKDSSKYLRSSVVHYDVKSGKTLHGVEDDKVKDKKDVAYI